MELKITETKTVEKTKTMDFEKIELSFKRLCAFDKEGNEYMIRNKNLMRNTITIDKENGVQFKNEIEIEMQFKNEY